MENNLRKAENITPDIVGFFAFKTNSNNPGTVTAYPGWTDLPPYTSRSTKLIHEQVDLNRQVQNCAGWRSHFSMGVIR